MKKIALSALVAATLVSAADFNYEITPVAGYLWNSTSSEVTGPTVAQPNAQPNEGAMGPVQNHAVYGIEVQANNLEFMGIKPELSVLYGRDTATDAFSNGEQFIGVLDVMLNGVYEIDTGTFATPFAKVGIGYEWLTNNSFPSNYDGMLFDAGLGVKMDLTKHIALKLEGLYMYKINNGGTGVDFDGSTFDDHSNGEVHNVAALAGLTFSFDEKEVAAPAPAPVVAAPAPIPAAVVTPVVAALAPAEKVCPVNVDSDKDGVFDPQDKCLDTPAGFKVDAEGCPLKATLHLNFITNGHGVDAAGIAKVNAFAAFLKDNTAYKASIVGHTDSTGSDKHNQTLSEKRAEMVKTMLVDQGIAADRLTASGKGEKMSVASNKTKQGRAENRRIEVELTH